MIKVFSVFPFSKQLNRIIIFFILFSSQVWAGGEWVIDLIGLKYSEQKKLSFLLDVKKRVPKLFSDAAEYNIDLMKILEDESKLMKVLIKYPEWRNLFAEKKFHKLTITPPSDGSLKAGEVQIKPEAIADWKNQLSIILKDVKKDIEFDMGQPLEILEAQLQDQIKILNKYAISEKEIKGIYQKIANPYSSKKMSLDQTQKARANQEILKSIQNENRKNYQEGLRKILESYDRFQDLPGALDKDFLSQAISVLKAKSKIKDLAYLKIILGHFHPVFWVDAQENIDSLDSNKLLFFKDADGFDPIANDQLKAVADPFKTDVINGIKNTLTSYASQTDSKLESITRPITLTQVPPGIGIFRGCTGGDCSSQYSFPYPNDPHERVYFIQDQDRVLKGYVSATEVMQEDQKCLYVITISGSRVSGGDTELILRGLDQAKNELGVQCILIPIEQKLDSLINFPSSRAIYERYSNGKPEVRIQYLNPELRREIERFKSSNNSGSYDHMNYNSHGVIFKTKDSLSRKIKLSQENVELQRLGSRPLQEVPMDEIFDFLLSLSNSKIGDTLERVFKIYEIGSRIKRSQFDTFIRDLKECTQSNRKVTISQWINHLRELVAQFGVSRDFIFKEASFIYPGIAKCEDSYSNQEIDTVANLIVKDIKENKLKAPDWVFSHANELKKTPIFKKFFLRLVEDLRGNTTTAGYARFLLQKFKPADLDTYRALAEALKDENVDVRQSVVHVLADIKPTESNILRALVEALKDKSDLVRFHAGNALVEIKPADFNLKLAFTEALKDESDLVRRGAATALGDMNPADPNVHQALAEALKDESSFVRESVAKALGKIKPMDPNIHRALAEALKDKSLKVRAEATTALGKIKPTDPKIHWALAEALKDEIEGVRSGAAWALGEIKPADLNIHWALVEALKERTMGIQAAEALGKIKPSDPNIHRALVRALEDETNLSRFNIAIAFAEIKPTDPNVRQILAKALEDWNLDKKGKAAMALIKIINAAESCPGSVNEQREIDELIQKLNPILNQLMKQFNSTLEPD